MRVQLLKLSPLPPSEDEHLSISGRRSRLSSHCTAVQDLIIWKFFTENCMNLTRWKKETINSINVQIQGLSTRARNELKSEREKINPALKTGVELLRLGFRLLCLLYINSITCYNTRVTGVDCKHPLVFILMTLKTIFLSLHFPPFFQN